MNKRKLHLIDLKIQRIKKELMDIGEMRPGSLTQQNRGTKKEGSYYQLSYTHQMTGRTEYVRPKFAGLVKQQIATYKRFRKRVEEWIRLAIQHAQIKMDIAKKIDSG